MLIFIVLSLPSEQILKTAICVMIFLKHLRIGSPWLLLFLAMKNHILKFPKSWTRSNIIQVVIMGTFGMYHIGNKTSTGIPLFCTVSNSDDSGFLGWLTHWRLLLSQVQCVLDLLANKSCMLLLIVNQMQTGDHHPDVFWRLLSRQKYQFICSILERVMSQATRLLLYGAKKNLHL